jgi:hypothetical protein
MGYNTVAFILNDFSSEFEKSPKTVAWRLAHPPHRGDEKSFPGYWDKVLNSLSRDFNESRLHSQALEILPTFHANETKFLRAGGNCIVELKPVRYGKTKEGKRTVTLELPDWDDGNNNG